MVNTDRMTAEMVKEFAFSEEELASLAKARNIPIVLMKIVRKRLLSAH